MEGYGRPNHCRRWTKGVGRLRWRGGLGVRPAWLQDVATEHHSGCGGGPRLPPCTPPSLPHSLSTPGSLYTLLSPSHSYLCAPYLLVPPPPPRRPTGPMTRAQGCWRPVSALRPIVLGRFLWVRREPGLACPGLRHRSFSPQPSIVPLSVQQHLSRLSSVLPTPFSFLIY